MCSLFSDLQHYQWAQCCQAERQKKNNGPEFTFSLLCMTTTTTGGGLPVGVSVEDTKCLNRPLGAIKNPLQSLTIVIFLIIIMIIISSSSCCQRLFCYHENSKWKGDPTCQNSLGQDTEPQTPKLILCGLCHTLYEWEWMWLVSVKYVEWSWTQEKCHIITFPLTTVKLLYLS